MALRQKIQEELNQAVKERNEISSTTLRMLLAGIIDKEKSKRFTISKEKPELKEEELVEKSNLTDEEIISVVSSEVKKRKEAALEFEKGDRRELAEKEKTEMEILIKYLPEQLSDEELEEIVKVAVEKVGALTMKDIGKVMAEVMPKVKGKADGNQINQIVKNILSS